MATRSWCVLACIILFSVSVSADHVEFTAKVTDNPADELVAEINSNRTSRKGSSALFNNPGLACIALQFIKAYQGDCGAVGGKNAKKPADFEIPKEFAPNCGVEASSVAPFTGRLLGCQSKYVQPKQAFSDILVTNDKALEIVHNSNHTEVGAGVSGADGGGPYFWCVLFSNGKGNSSFTLEGGVAKSTRPGCYSGTNDDCGAGYSLFGHPRLWPIFIAALVAMSCAF
ncbi:Pathogenesis-related PR-1 type [Heracleum sosnowskyi]|uniref:Pathogenesis-related PR-1 type n=1 Tax=Heracleum sosnowskyi TaxID=360622 RepID=A0AAD8HSY0_9APIA|nr:Pathogenesis-related PR-1 type [Heracleum sosnowskyi]